MIGIGTGRAYTPEPQQAGGCICRTGQCLRCLHPDGACHEHEQPRCSRCWRCPDCKLSRDMPDHWAARAFACASCG